VLDVIEKIINGIDDMISGLGGLKGVLSVASTLLLNTFGDNIVKNIQRITDNFKQNSGISTLR
jgi:hypothetical protein